MLPTYNTNTRGVETRFQIEDQPKLHNETLPLKRGVGWGGGGCRETKRVTYNNNVTGL